MSKNGGWRELDAAAHQSLTRFHNRTNWEPTSNDMPYARSLDAPFASSFREMLAQAGDFEVQNRQWQIAAQWKALQGRANELIGTPGHAAAQRAADDFYHLADEEKGIDHARDITAGLELGAPPKASESDVRERMIGAMALFAFLQKRGNTPMDFFRQFTAAGRALHREPWSLMTMHEVAMMEGQSAAAHSWRCMLVSGEIDLAGMKGSVLPGQKSKEARESYRKCRKGNKNRAKKPKRARQGSFLAKLKTTPPAKQQSFLRTLKVSPKTKSPRS